MEKAGTVVPAFFVAFIKVDFVFRLDICTFV